MRADPHEPGRDALDAAHVQRKGWPGTRTSNGREAGGDGVGGGGDRRGDGRLRELRGDASGPAPPSRVDDCTVEVFVATRPTYPAIDVAAAHVECHKLGGRHKCMTELRREACRAGADANLRCSRDRGARPHLRDGDPGVAGPVNPRQPDARGGGDGDAAARRRPARARLRPDLFAGLRVRGGAVCPPVQSALRGR